MPDRSREFAEACTSRSTLLPSTSSGSTGNKAKSEALRRRRRRKEIQQQASSQQQHDSSSSSSSNINLNDPDVDVWTLEATRIASAIASLALFLSSIRRAYLDLSASSASNRGTGINSIKGKGVESADRNVDLSKGLFEAWKGVKYLTDRERDEVDWQAKTVLKRCMQRIRDLEQAEKNRHAKAQAALSRVPSNNFTKFLGLPSSLVITDSQATEEQLNGHRQQITLFLSRRLADVGHVQQEQQELRVKRQLERQSLSTNPATLQIPASKLAGGTGNGKGGPDGVPSIFVPAPMSSHTVSKNGAQKNSQAPHLDDEDDGDDEYAPIESMLSASQIQQFESESSALLQEANSQLAAIEKAQTSLLEISNLQAELATHLTQQMELTDKLWEDSVLVTGRVEEGNKQLQKARERNRESRVWLLVFLVGASLSLLFLEYY